MKPAPRGCALINEMSQPSWIVYKDSQTTSICGKGEEGLGRGMQTDRMRGRWRRRQTGLVNPNLKMIKRHPRPPNCAVQRKMSNREEATGARHRAELPQSGQPNMPFFSKQLEK